jgi:hypothetical protein
VRFIPFFALAACGDPFVSTLADQRDKWDAAALDDYAYTLQYGCFCPREYTTPVRITVVADAVTSAVYAEDNEPVVAGDPAPEDYDTFTIDGLFDEAERALREADDTTLAFDPTYGFPSTLNIDWEFDMADEEQAYTASDLVPAE